MLYPGLSTLLLPAWVLRDGATAAGSSSTPRAAVCPPPSEVLVLDESQEEEEDIILMSTGPSSMTTNRTPRVHSGQPLVVDGGNGKVDSDDDVIDLT